MGITDIERASYGRNIKEVSGELARQEGGFAIWGCGNNGQIAQGSDAKIHATGECCNAPKTERKWGERHKDLGSEESRYSEYSIYNNPT